MFRSPSSRCVAGTHENLSSTTIAIVELATAIPPYSEMHHARSKFSTDLREAYVAQRAYETSV